METNKQRLKRLRAEFREGVFKRDGYRCRVCGRTTDIDAHHIEDRHRLANGGYAISNGITLCGGDREGTCHWKAEEFHITEGARWEPGFSPAELFALIGSSPERAMRDSENLK